MPGNPRRIHPARKCAGFGIALYAGQGEGYGACPQPAPRRREQPLVGTLGWFIAKRADLIELDGVAGVASYDLKLLLLGGELSFERFASLEFHVQRFIRSNGVNLIPRCADLTECGCLDRKLLAILSDNGASDPITVFQSNLIGT